MAVSGGIDSMVLLDMFAQSDRNYSLEVGFIDHGWRSVAKELDLVRRRSSELGLKLHEASLNLTNKSEAAARRGRYKALEQMRVVSNSEAVVTAHHADDQIETVVLNLLRGTGRKGLEGMGSTKTLLRPLLGVAKSEIKAYAKVHNIEWVEDPTNLDNKYRRNLVRQELLPKLSMDDPGFEADVMKVAVKIQKLNSIIDRQLNQLINVSGKMAAANLVVLINLQPEVLQELLVFMAKRVDSTAELDALMVERLAIDLKTGHFIKPRQLTKRLLARRADGKLTIEFNGR